MLCIDVRITISRLFLSMTNLKLFTLLLYSFVEKGSFTFSPFFKEKKSGLSIKFLLIQSDISLIPSHYKAIIYNRNKKKKSSNDCIGRWNFINSK